MYNVGSINGKDKFNKRQNFKKHVPNSYTFACNASLKSINKYGDFSVRHTIYKHAATTCAVRRPCTKLRCTANKNKRWALST